MSNKLTNLLKRLWSEDEAASAVEYALLLGAIATVIAVATYALGGTVDGLISDASDAITGS